MHSQPPGRRRRGDQPPPSAPYGQPPAPRGPYEEEPPEDLYQTQQWQPQPGPYEEPPRRDPYQPRHWQPQPGTPYQQLPPAGPHQQEPWGPSNGTHQQPPRALSHQQPPPPRKKRHRGLKITLGVLGGIFALIVIGSIASALGGNKSGTGTSAGSSINTGTGNTPAAQSARSAAAPGIGDKVRDGKFQFVITKVTHAKSVGDTSLGLGDTAQGEYTILHITVTNIGNQAQTLDDSSQYVYDSHGRKYDASSSADIDMSGANGQNSTWLDDINPGNTVHGRIAFDLPAGDKAVQAELHDSMFSGGVTVKL
jgi:hypothetical protein